MKRAGKRQTTDTIPTGNKVTENPRNDLIKRGKTAWIVHCSVTVRNKPPFHFLQVLLLGTHGFSCVFGIYIQAFVAEAQVLPGSLPGRAHWPLPPSPAIPCHTPVGNVSESPVGTRVQDYRSFAESPVGTPLRSYRCQKHPFAEAMPR